MKARRAAALVLGAATLAITAGASCAPAEPAKVPEGLVRPFTGYSSETYGDPDMWLCRPDLPEDACRIDLTTTEILADGSRSVVTYAPAGDNGVDCFYVYPTVDSGFFAKNHEDFEDREPMANVVMAQAAHFGEVCRLFAPLYRQVSLGTYLSWASRRDAFLDVAFSDVDDAFLEYMSHYNGGRRIVLIGHSQGAEMIVRLLRKRFDADPAMRERLVVAMPIGGNFEVPLGKRAGGTLENIRLCESLEEKSCVIAYRSHGTSEPVSAMRAPEPGMKTACVHPLGDGRYYFSRAIFPMVDDVRDSVKGIDGITTPYVAFRDYYAGRCAEGEDGYRYMEVWAAPEKGDQRVDPYDLDRWFLNTPMGLHVLDLQFAQGDLIEAVRVKAGVWAPPQSISPRAPE